MQRPLRRRGGCVQNQPKLKLMLIRAAVTGFGGAVGIEQPGCQFGASGEFEDLVGSRLGTLDLLQLVDRDCFRFFDRSRGLALQRNDFSDFEARRLHDVLQVTRAQPAHRLAQTPEGGGRDTRAARQPVAEDDIVSSPGADAVGRQQTGYLLDVKRVLQR